MRTRRQHIARIKEAEKRAARRRHDPHSFIPTMKGKFVVDRESDIEPDWQERIASNRSRHRATLQGIQED